MSYFNLGANGMRLSFIKYTLSPCCEFEAHTHTLAVVEVGDQNDQNLRKKRQQRHDEHQLNKT